MARVILILTTFVASSLICADAKINVEPPEMSVVLYGYSATSVKNQIDTGTVDHIEGIWEFPEDRVTVSVENVTRNNNTLSFSHQIVILESDNLEIIPGTILGYIADSGIDDEFNIWIYSSCNDNGILSDPVKCYAKLTESHRTLKIEKPEIKPIVRINFARFLPGFFKGLYVSFKKKNVESPIGMRKIYPKDSKHSNEIIYL